MKLTKTALIICCLFTMTSVGQLHAADLFTVKGVVITPDGIVVPQFSVLVKPVTNKPELVDRRHFKRGEFVIDGLETGKYQIDVVAPLYIRSRVVVELKAGSQAIEAGGAFVRARRTA